MHFLSPIPFRAPAPGNGAGRSGPALALAVQGSGDVSALDGAFIALQNAYRPHGGLLRLSALNLRAQHAAPKEDVADPEAAGEWFGFRCYGTIWVPMFQFALPGHALVDAPRRVVAELGGPFDGWALATWFVQPNAWLGHHRPIECLARCLPDVLQAARADRFVATG